MRGGAMTETKQWKDDYGIVQTSKKLSKAIYLDLAKHIKLQNDEALSCYFLIKSEEIENMDKIHFPEGRLKPTPSFVDIQLKPIVNADIINITN